MRFNSSLTHPSFWRVFWLDATTVETTKQSFQDIALEPEAQAAGVKESVDDVYRWLSRVEHEWLLVFDGADHEPNAVVQFLLPSKQGNVLITSRNPDMQILSPGGCMEVVD